MKSTGTFIGVLATSKQGTGSAACRTNASITFQKLGAAFSLRARKSIASLEPLQAHHNKRPSSSIHESHVLQLWLSVRSFSTLCPVAVLQSVGTLSTLFPAHKFCRYSFTPLSWILPSEYTKFMRDYYQEREKDEFCLFIAKPADLSRGRFVRRWLACHCSYLTNFSRGIYLVRELSEIVYDQPYILQQYVQRPLTIDGFKFDLRCLRSRCFLFCGTSLQLILCRIYVVVLSVHPLVAFVYNQGIARFATHK
jgi:hypothetical protein